jgi:TonB family protein
MMKYFRLAAICLSVLAVSATAFAQGPKTRGIELYGQKNYPDAIRLLTMASKDKTTSSDPAVWNYLGLANIESDKPQDAQKAFEHAVKLDPKNAAYRVNLAYAYMLLKKVDKAEGELESSLALDPKNVSAYYLRGRSNLWEHKLDDALQDTDRLLQIDPSYSAAYVLKSDVLVSKLGDRVAAGSTIKKESELLKEAKDGLSLGISLAKTPNDITSLRKDLESVTAFYEYAVHDAAASTLPAPNVVSLSILNKRPALYTDLARKRGIQGRVQLAVLFGASGRVEQVIVLKRLGYGLDENAIASASAIKFDPKMVDGKPVSTVMIMEYSFHIY